ncbi:MAG TPA: holo-ACP synthase [Phycisphaerales bacterium]|nr:holo-ACP synthase [Phycisphaerales bacterium]HMP38341.1 holo-ACP synthase [Phycisphaerales bacterium]
MRILGHGIDIVENARIAGLIDAHGEQFLDRCFTPAERAYAESTRRRRVERYAVRFAAKEAVLKALGTGWRDGIGWRDVEVLRLPSGEPRLLLAGHAERFAQSRGVDEWRTSLSHTDHYAVASAIAIAFGPASGAANDVAEPERLLRRSMARG